MNVYQINFVGLIGLCAVLYTAQRSKASSPEPETTNSKATPSSKKNGKPSGSSSDSSQWAFLLVYALVMGSDWLQGPYLYSLYHDEHHIAPSLISTLFTTGFLSGALSGTFIGRLADTWGRKRACLLFCGAYALSCLLTIAVPDLLLLDLASLGLNKVPVLLFAGRVLGGLGTSLLFSVFESWMVADFARRQRLLESKGQGGAAPNLSRTFGTMGTLNSLVAIASGVGSEWLVGVAGTRKAPFVAAVGLLVVAAWVIAWQWTENYGDSASVQEPAITDKKGSSTSPAKPAPKLWQVLASPQVLSLGLASTMFEGSMYLFVFFWTPALRSAQASTSSTTSADLPYGTIFASFMAATLASSLAFNALMERKLLRYSTLLAGVLGTSTACFALLVSPRSEQTTFWLFCVFEAMVGMYWPCMGYLKGRLVEDGVRAQVYAVLRIPLNVFVVVSLLFTGDGDAYGPVFSTCAKLLLASCGALWGLSLGKEAP